MDKFKTIYWDEYKKFRNINLIEEFNYPNPDTLEAIQSFYNKEKQENMENRRTHFIFPVKKEKVKRQLKVRTENLENKIESNIEKSKNDIIISLVENIEKMDFYKFKKKEKRIFLKYFKIKIWNWESTHFITNKNLNN